MFQALGTRYGVAGQLPDLRGEFIRGADLGRGVDANRVLGSWQDFDFSAHSHGYYSANGDSDYGGGGAGAPAKGTPRFEQTTTTDGLRDGLEVRPRNVALLPCIKF